MLVEGALIEALMELDSKLARDEKKVKAGCAHALRRDWRRSLTGKDPIDTATTTCRAGS